MVTNALVRRPVLVRLLQARIFLFKGKSLRHNAGQIPDNGKSIDGAAL